MWSSGPQKGSLKIYVVLKLELQNQYVKTQVEHTVVTIFKLKIMASAMLQVVKLERPSQQNHVHDAETWLNRNPVQNMHNIVLIKNSKPDTCWPI